MKFAQFDVVVLEKDIPEEGLKAGMVGTILEIYKTPQEGYEVEFCDKFGVTVALLALRPDQIRKR